jgi:hypothetical protein
MRDASPFAGEAPRLCVHASRMTGQPDQARFGQPDRDFGALASVKETVPHNFRSECA